VTPLRFIQITAVDKNIFNGKGKSKGNVGALHYPLPIFTYQSVLLAQLNLKDTHLLHAEISLV